MGEIADAMLEGTLCTCCGEFIGSSCGYPRRCPACEIDEAKVPQVKTRRRRKRAKGKP